MANYDFVQKTTTSGQFYVEVEIDDDCYRVGSIVEWKPPGANPNPSDLECLTFVVDYTIGCEPGHGQKRQLRFDSFYRRDDDVGNYYWIIVYDTKSKEIKRQSKSAYKLADTRPKPA